MKVARVELANGTVTYAVQQADGRLLRAEGDLMAGDIAATADVVEPKRWLPPIVPRAILCIGRNYAEHAAEGVGQGVDHPHEGVLESLPGLRGGDQHHAPGLQIVSLGHGLRQIMRDQRDGVQGERVRRRHGI